MDGLTDGHSADEPGKSAEEKENCPVFADEDPSAIDEKPILADIVQDGAEGEKQYLVSVNITITSNYVRSSAFEYLDMCESPVEFPVLVLALKDEYDIIDREGWRYIAHQTAGHACHNHYMLGKILTPNDGIMEKMKKINDHWLDSDCGFGAVTLDDINQYRAQLNDILGVDCNLSYTDFE